MLLWKISLKFTAVKFELNKINYLYHIFYCARYLKSLFSFYAKFNCVIKFVIYCQNFRLISIRFQITTCKLAKKKKNTSIKSSVEITVRNFLIINLKNLLNKKLKAKI